MAPTLSDLHSQMLLWMGKARMDWVQPCCLKEQKSQEYYDDENELLVCLHFGGVCQNLKSENTSGVYSAYEYHPSICLMKKKKKTGNPVLDCKSIDYWVFTVLWVGNYIKRKNKEDKISASEQRGMHMAEIFIIWGWITRNSRPSGHRMNWVLFPALGLYGALTVGRIRYLVHLLFVSPYLSMERKRASHRLDPDVSSVC